MQSGHDLSFSGGRIPVVPGPCIMAKSCCIDAKTTAKTTRRGTLRSETNQALTQNKVKKLTGFVEVQPLQHLQLFVRRRSRGPTRNFPAPKREQCLSNQNLPLLDASRRGRNSGHRHLRRNLQSTGRRPRGPRLRRLRNVRRLGASLDETLNPPAFSYTFGGTIRLIRALATSTRRPEPKSMVPYSSLRS